MTTHPNRLSSRRHVAASILLLAAAGLIAGCKSTSSANDTSSASMSATAAPSENASTGTTSSTAEGSATSSESVPPAASDDVGALLTQAQDLGLCDSGWESDLEAIKSMPLSEEVAPPQESWTCTAKTTTIEVARWSTDTEVKGFFSVLAGSAEQSGADLTKYSFLQPNPATVIGAADASAGATNLETLEMMQAEVGGEIVTYAQLTGQG